MYSAGLSMQLSRRLILSMKYVGYGCGAMALYCTWFFQCQLDPCQWHEVSLKNLVFLWGYESVQLWHPAASELIIAGLCSLIKSHLRQTQLQRFRNKVFKWHGKSWLRMSIIEQSIKANSQINERIKRHLIIPAYEFSKYISETQLLEQPHPIYSRQPKYEIREYILSLY